MAEDVLRLELDASDLTRAAAALSQAARVAGVFTGGRGLSLSGAGGAGLAAGRLFTPAQAALTAFTVTLTAATAIANRFGQQLATAGAALLATGGSRGEFAGLSATLAAAGIDAGQIPGIAARVRSLRGGGRAAAELGFQPGREVAPGLNEAQGLADVVGQILSPLISEERALAKARLAELEELLPLRQVMRDHTRELARETQLRKSLADPTTLYHATEFQYQLRNIGESFNLLGQSLAQFVLPGVGFLAKTLNSMVDDLTIRLDRLAGLLGFKSGQGAAEQQRRALDDNTQALKTMTKEFANAGPRAAGAVPAGLHGPALQRAIEAHAIRLGAFDIS